MSAIDAALADVSIGQASTYQNLAMFPLIALAGRSAPYYTLDEALALDGIRLTEVSHEGSVPELRVANSLDRPVLLLDGEEIVGAKQNRVFNLTILVPAATELLVPVSCVEHGRWSSEAPEFRPSPRAQYAAGRAERLSQVSDSLSHGDRRSDQSRVWANIEAKRARMDVESPTHAMSDIYERFSGSVDEYVRALARVEGQAGAVFALNADVVGVDLFDAGSTLHALLPKLVRSYALDAIEAPVAGAVPDAGAVHVFLHDLAGAAPDAFPAVGLGEDVRLKGPGVSGAALVLDERVIHLCAFRAPDSHTAAPRTAMRRAAARRAHFEP